MPFKLCVSNVEYRKGEIAISGRLTEGSYSGPEAISVCGHDGRWITATIDHHILHNPEDWPVLPSHKTVLTISIDPGVAFQVDETQPVIGYGSVFENPNREEVSHLLSEPLFWAMQLGLNLSTEEVDEPHELYFGVTTDEVNRFYETEIHSRFHTGVWPFITVPINASNYFELEFAASIEHQQRYWIGESTTNSRVLLGYHSGHFSLPAFRVEEVLSFHQAVSGRGDRGGVSLLPFSGCYINESTDAIRKIVAQWFSELPGTKPGGAQVMAQAFLENLTVADLHWEYNADYGWINNWRYSQRNPSGSMSNLQGNDYLFIRCFFENLGEPSPPAIE